jgi:hypothetical protein
VKAEVAQALTFPAEWQLRGKGGGRGLTSERAQYRSTVMRASLRLANLLRPALPGPLPLPPSPDEPHKLQPSTDSTTMRASS